MDLRTWLLAAALASWPAACAEEFTLALIADSETPVQPALAGAMEKELASLLSPAGIGLDFQLAAPVNHVGLAGAVVSLRLQGETDGVTCSGGAARLGVLGWIQRVDGEFQPRIVADLPQIADHLARVYEPNRRAMNDQCLGVALARVVMHELLHYFTGSASHRSTTLFSESIAPYTLIVPGVRLEDEEVQAIREGIERLTRTSTGGSIP